MKPVDPALVPYAVLWSAEADRQEVRPCRYVGGRAAFWQPDKRGEGEPLWKQMHPVRYRQLVAERLCMKCGRATGPFDRWVFPYGQWSRRGDAMVFLIEPSMHRRCAEMAETTCPVLSGRRDSALMAAKAMTPCKLRGSPQKITISHDVHGQAVIRAVRFVLSEKDARRTFGDQTPPFDVAAHLSQPPAGLRGRAA